MTSSSPSEVAEKKQQNATSPQSSATYPLEIPESRGWRRTIYVLGPLLGLMIYILSAGPVAGLVKKARAQDTPFVKQVIEVAYAPVIFLAKRTPLGKPLRWYAKLWGA